MQKDATGKASVFNPTVKLVSKSIPLVRWRKLTYSIHLSIVGLPPRQTAQRPSTPTSARRKTWSRRWRRRRWALSFDQALCSLLLIRGNRIGRCGLFRAPDNEGVGDAEQGGGAPQCGEEVPGELQVCGRELCCGEAADEGVSVLAIDVMRRCSLRCWHRWSMDILALHVFVRVTPP